MFNGMELIHFCIISLVMKNELSITNRDFPQWLDAVEKPKQHLSKVMGLTHKFIQSEYRQCIKIHKPADIFQSSKVN